jgi:apolipoprotein D and lipocalin family protein
MEIKMISIRGFWGILTVSAIALAAYGQDSSPLTTVAKVDLKRYAGLWHEIARIPNRFQKQCAWGVTAEYALRADGRIDVVNRCYDSNGRIEEAKGLARVEDKSSNARLGVSFFSILGWRPVWGDYWIIGLGDDYQYAVVGAPGRNYGWILARERKLDEEVLKKIFAMLREQGYDPERFQMTRQEVGAGKNQ